MKHKCFKTLIAISAGIILPVWLFCLPTRMFDNTPYSTVVTASKGELLGARVADDGQWRFPPGDTIPEKFAKAVVEYEDRTFYSHFGVSLRGMGRAVFQNITNGRIVSGGSTITMQTIRLHRHGKRNLFEKMIEVFMATRLEARHSKEDILLMYASHAPFGGNVVGIEAAVWRYLGNNGNEMSWAEAATLAVLQNAPSAIHLSKNRDKLLAKRNRLLKRLYEKGELTADEYELSTAEPLIGRPFEMPQLAPHFVEYHHKTNHGKYIRTAIKFSLQNRLEDLCAYWRIHLSQTGINDLSAVVVSVKTNSIVAYCGNADLTSERDGKWVDIARAPRSSGSILKPLLYCAALQEGVILENTILPDVPTDFGGFVPKNFDGSYCGVVEARRALSLSLNVPNVWLLKEFGVARFASLLQKCGLSTISKSPDNYGLSLILGGAEVSLTDIVHCYAKIARFQQNFPLHDSIAIYSMLDAMREVNRPDELDVGRAVSAQNIGWKTGTSYGARDGWAIGLTPEYVVGVWVGNADGRGVADLTGARTAGPVMFDIFNLLPTCGWFGQPQGRQQKICTHSGHRAGKYCMETRMEVIPQNGIRSKECPYCVEIPMSTDRSHRVVDASEPAIMMPYFQLPPVQKYYYTQTHADYIEPPSINIDSESEMRFIYPADGSVMMLPRRSDSTEAQIICKAVHSNANAELFWHLDDNYLGSTMDIHQMQIKPSPGAHKLTVFDNFGARKTIEIIIK